MDNFTKHAEKYTEQDFTIGQTKFSIEKLLPMEGFRVLEEIRAALGTRLANTPADSGVATVIASVALSIPPAVVDTIMRDMFAHVTFTNHLQATRATLAGNEGTAFDGLEPVNVYEVFVRCLAVNFFSSLEDGLSRLGKAGKDSPPPVTKT